MGEVDAFDRIELARAGDHEALAWLLGCIDRWVDDECARPLEVVLQLPTTPAARRRYRRDRWLRAAAREVDADGPWIAAGTLKRELDTFLSRGGWLAWRALDAPPPGTSRLRTALFFFAKLHDGQDLSQRQIFDIARGAFPQKPRAEPSTLEPSASPPERTRESD